MCLLGSRSNTVRAMARDPCRYFNTVQSESFLQVFSSTSNVVVSAPTGSGKTVIMELAMLRLFSPNIDAAGVYQHRPG